MRVIGFGLSSRRVGGRINVRTVLSALEVRRLVPSGVLGSLLGRLVCKDLV